MARMVFGNYETGDRTDQRRVVHLHAEGRQVSFGPTACGTYIRPMSPSETTERRDWVNCKNCLRAMERGDA